MIALSDCEIIKDSPHSYIPPEEIRDVISLVGAVAYALYSVYRTVPFKGAKEFSDEGISELLNWPVSKVQGNRISLQESGLITSVRYGDKREGFTRLFVGYQTVSAFHAGTPS